MRNLLTIFKNSGKILEGIQNSVFKKEHVEQIASARMQICVSCVSIDHQGKSCLAPGTQPCCSQCGCSLAFKLRSLSSACPLAHWPAVLSDAEDNALTASLD